jgi:hypothetical protein
MQTIYLYSYSFLTYLTTFSTVVGDAFCGGASDLRLDAWVDCAHGRDGGLSAARSGGHCVYVGWRISFLGIGRYAETFALPEGDFSAYCM